MVNPKDYTRKITHTQYTFSNKAAEEMGILNKLDKEISHHKRAEIKKEVVKAQKHFKYVDHNYIQLIDGSKVIPIGGGGVFFLFFIFSIASIFIANDTEPPSITYYSFMVFFFLGFVFFVYYYVTMPPKETIYNRKDSLVTFPGFMWHKNITMSIHDVEFAYSQPSAQGIGAYQLRIVRPDKLFSQAFGWFSGNCYEDLSYILWYMDKNRPLPPGDAFDEFRESDFQRRKTSGFPKPLFPSRFPTPEATPEQQEERERIGGW